MPPKRPRTRKRTQTTPDEGPSSRRSRRVSTRNSTLASQAMSSTPPVPSAVSTSDTSSMDAAQNWPTDLIPSLVAAVTEEVTRRLAATVPASTTPCPAPSREDRQPSFCQPPSGSTATLVDGAISAAHSHITGSPQLLPNSSRVSSDTPGQIFLSASLPIDSQVSAKLKGKIWNEEFIDFGSLLSNPGQDKYQFSVQNSVAGIPASFCLEPVTRPKKIINIDAWQQAFHIFVGVYTQKYPHEAPALMKYGESIRDLAARGQNWRYYDENFRYLRQTQRSLVPWGTIHGELWLRSQCPNKTPAVTQNNHVHKAGVSRVPSGFCFKFHRGQFCAGNCSFKHECFKCKGTHRATQCNFRGPTGKAFTVSDRAAQSPSHASKTKTSG